jgi:hypothetical protein
MFSGDRAEQEELLAEDHVAERVQAQHMLDVLPKDMQKYLLSFCDIQDIGRLAQVDRKFHDLINDASFHHSYEVRSNFLRLMPDMNGDEQIQTQPGYVRGSYAQLRNFFTVRDREERRLAELESGCYINHVDEEAPCLGAKIGFSIGLGLCTTVTGYTTWFYLAIKEPLNLLKITGPFAGVSCLLCTGSAICLCAGQRIVRNKNERDALKSQLTGVPGPASLHDTMFSWQPTVAHQDHAPATLRMNE